MSKIPFTRYHGTARQQMYSSRRWRKSDSLIKVCCAIIDNSFFRGLRSVGFGVLFILPILNACASSAKPTQIFLEKEKVANFNRILLTVSVAEPAVEYSQAKPRQVGFALGILGYAIENEIKRSEDQKTAEVTVKTLTKEWCELIVSDVSRDQLTGKRGIQLLSIKAPPTPTECQNFLSEGYTHLLSFTLVDLSLRLATGDVLFMYAEMQGNLTSLASSEVGWSRYETTMSEQFYSIDRYMANEGELLRSVAGDSIKRVTQRLLYDFVYAK